MLRCSRSCFFSSRRRHTIYWRDWSSDVCSSDLVEQAALPADPHPVEDVELGLLERRRHLVLDHLDTRPVADHLLAVLEGLDRKSVVQGKSVDRGGRRIIKKKYMNHTNRQTMGYH